MIMKYDWRKIQFALYEYDKANNNILWTVSGPAGITIDGQPLFMVIGKTKDPTSLLKMNPEYTAIQETRNEYISRLTQGVLPIHVDGAMSEYSFEDVIKKMVEMPGEIV